MVDDTNGRFIDRREEDQKQVAACEGDRCRPRVACMISECVNPALCKATNSCYAREIFVNG